MMNIRPLDPALQEIAKAELNEDPKRLPDDIQHLRDWISKQQHLNARTDDQWLVAILRGCKFSLERVKRKLDLFYTLRTTAPDITRRLKPTDEKFFQVLRLGVCVILPKSKTLSPRVMLLRPGAYDPSQYNVADLLCIFYYLTQILVLEDDTATVIGTKVLVDYQGVSMTHVAAVTAGLVKKMVAITQDAMPMRLKGSHHLNLPASVETVFGLVKNLIGEKAKQRLKLHKSPQELFDHLPVEVIPSEYGGSAGTVREIAAYWEDKFISYRSWLQHEEQFGTDESKRVGQPRSPEQMFGMEGSFRKLQLD